VDVPYSTRLERGDLAGASDGVLDALARALRLDDAEHAHLRDLARAAQPIAPPPRRRQARHRIRPAVRQLLDAMTGAAAHVGNDRLDVLAANPLGRALYLEMFDGQERPNAARFVFLDPRARDFYLDWDRTARDVVATLRPAAGRNPDDRDPTDLVGELSTPQRGVPPPLGQARRPLPHQRREALPPPPGRRPREDVALRFGVENRVRELPRLWPVRWKRRTGRRCVRPDHGSPRADEWSALHSRLADPCGDRRPHARRRHEQRRDPRRLP
jgi:hypothetical protein